MRLWVSTFLVGLYFFSQAVASGDGKRYEIVRGGDTKERFGQTPSQIAPVYVWGDFVMPPRPPRAPRAPIHFSQFPVAPVIKKKSNFFIPEACQKAQTDFSKDLDLLQQQTIYQQEHREDYQEFLSTPSEMTRQQLSRKELLERFEALKKVRQNKSEVMNLENFIAAKELMQGTPGGDMASSNGFAQRREQEKETETAEERRKEGKISADSSEELLGLYLPRNPRATRFKVEQKRSCSQLPEFY